MIQESTKIGKRGALIIPAALRRQFDLHEGSPVIAEECDEGILIRPAAVVPLERYSNERKAEFLLANAVDKKDYTQAVKAVRAMGIDPASIPHSKPKE